jgi:hypothetical protein
MKIKKKKICTTSSRILIIAVFSVLILTSGFASARTDAATTTEMVESTTETVVEASSTEQYEIVSVATWGDATGTPTRETEHTMNDLYVVLLLILSVLVVWFSFNTITKLVKIFTTTRWK